MGQERTRIIIWPLRAFSGMLIKLMELTLLIGIACELIPTISASEKTEATWMRRFVSPLTDIERSGNSARLPSSMIRFKNSSSQISRVSFQMTHSMIISECRSMSVFQLRHCEIRYISEKCVYSPMISVSSIVILDHLSMSTEGPIFSLLSIPENERQSSSYEEGSQFQILSSVLENVQGRESLSSSGILDSVLIRGSKFYNVSLVEGSRCSSICRECIVENAGMFDGENSLYGGLVSGVSSNTREMLLCENCTFERLRSNNHK